MPDFKDPYAKQRGGHNELTKQFPKVSGFLEALLTGVAPDQLSNDSVLDPLHEARQAGARAGYPLGTAAQVAPMLGPLSRIAEATGPVSGGRLAQRGVIKAPGGNWLNGSVEDSLQRLKRGAHYGPGPAEILPGSQTEAINNFVDKQLTRYVKNDMATERDPVRALAERGVLHVNPDQLNFRPETHGKYLEPGQTAVAQSPAAKSWEGASDLKVFNSKASDFLPNGDTWVPDTRATSNALGENPWLQKVAPETPVHLVGEPLTLAPDLGFDHLIDELRNAMNAHSQQQELQSWLSKAKTPAEEQTARQAFPVDLPEHLQLKPESLPRVSVPQAVEHVAKINEWRTAQKAEADAAKANNAATVLHKDYPEHGMKWVELKKPTATGNPEDAWNGNSPDKALETALKYEGDTMGHCVGGYCDDVASGKSRIFSLRDAKGQPHVTIETRPSGPKEDPRFGAGVNFDEQAHNDVMRAHPGMDDESEDYMYAVQERSQELADAWNAKQKTGQPDYIVQIKGKGNAAPADQYKPFAQDFVKSGQWSDVGDLQNTGLRKTSDVFGPTEMSKFRENGVELPTHLNDTERKAFQDQWYKLDTGRDVSERDPARWNPDAPTQSEQNFAQGGHVQPSEAQAEAGNYKKDHVWAHGLNISIENPADSIRSGKNADGEEWDSRMQHDYGYIRGTKGADKDHVDVFLGPDFKDRQIPVHVIDQHKENGDFDEHKVMMGFKTPEEAKEAYLGNYPHGWKGAKSVTPMHVDDFKKWVMDSSATKKPAAQNFAQGGSVSTSQVDRDREARLQSEHTNQVIKQMARGWLAGTVGIPGDLEGLTRHLIPGVSNNSILPTSGFYKEWLPGASEDPRLRTAADLASYTGGLGSGPLIKGTARLVTPLIERSGKILGEGALSKIQGYDYADGGCVNFGEGGSTGGDGPSGGRHEGDSSHGDAGAPSGPSSPSGSYGGYTPGQASDPSSPAFDSNYSNNYGGYQTGQESDPESASYDSTYAPGWLARNWPNIAQFALTLANPVLGTAFGAAKTVANDMSKPDSTIMGTIGHVLGNYALGQVGSAVNGVVGSAVGPEVSAGLSLFGQGAAVNNLFNGTNIPTSPGNYVAGALSSLASDARRAGENYAKNGSIGQTEQAQNTVAGSTTNSQPWHGGNVTLATDLGQAYPTASNNTAIYGAYEPSALGAHTLSVSPSSSVFRQGTTA